MRTFKEKISSGAAVSGKISSHQNYNWNELFINLLIIITFHLQIMYTLYVCVRIVYVIYYSIIH